MKHIACLLCLAAPAHAWDFAETDICRLTHTADDISVELTFDPEAALYTITLTQNATWPDGPSFQLRFDGARSFIIGTDQHVLDDTGRSLTVSDTGFGNVLDGIEYNTSMTALTGDAAVTVSTADAAEPMQAFRNCPSVPTS